MVNGKWEVAGGTKGKKMAQGKKSPKKTARKPEPSSLGATKVVQEEQDETFALKNPLKEHRNIFSMIEDSDSDHDNKENVITKARSTARTATKPTKKKSPPQQQPAKKTEREVLLDQLQEVSIEDLNDLVSDVQQKFPRHPLVWLKDIQSYFHMHVKLRAADPGMTMFEETYPWNMVETGVQEFIAGVYRDIPETTLVQFLLDCLNNFGKDVRSGNVCYHHRLMLQSLILSSPKTILNKTALLELQSMLSESTPRVRECVALLWLIQMTPRAKLDKKLQVWFTWMLPILQSKKTERQIQDYIVRCLENTINDIIDAKELVEISPSDFFGYFDLVFTINSNLYPQVQVLLLEMLETVKCMAFADEPERKLRSYFPSLLIRLQPAKSLQRDTILGYMVECLQLDPHCWILWQQLFNKNLNSSLTLLEHLHGQWPAVYKTFNRGALKQTLEYIVMTLTPNQGKRVKENQRRAAEIATDMLHALGSPLKAAAKLSFLIISIVLLGFVLLDIKQNGSFKASQTGQAVNGVIEHKNVKTALASAQVYCEIAHGYGMQYAPVLMEYLYTIYNSVLSTLTLGAVLLQENFNYAVDHREEITQQVRDAVVDAGQRVYALLTSLTTPENVKWAEETLVLVLERATDLAEMAMEYFWLALDLIVKYTEVAKQYITTHFIEDPVTVERVKGWCTVAYSWGLETGTFYFEQVQNMTTK